MPDRYLWHLSLVFLATTPLIAQQAQISPQTATFAAQSLTANANDDTRAIMDLMTKIEAATVKGDTDYVSSHTSPDFTMIHGDHWTNGGLAQLADDKAAYLKRVSDQFYIVHDLDPVSLRFEMHGDVAIVYGRYISVVRPNPAGKKVPGNITSIWFERVFQKQNGQWVYLSHRTVHGPINTPASIDPTAIPWDASRDDAGKISPFPPNYSAGAANAGVPIDKDPSVSKSPEVAEIIAFEQKQEAAVVNGDVAFLKTAVPDSFIMVHGDFWTRGGKPLAVDNKETFIKRAEEKYYKARDLSNEKVELHGNVAITYGRYLAYVGTGGVGNDSQKAWFAIWFERVYEKQPNGKWMFLSHRTVHGPTYGPTRESVSAVPEPYTPGPPWY